MSLKEELSRSHKNAIENVASVMANIQVQANEEMRKIIKDYVYPILRLIHRTNPREKTLSLRCEDQTVLHFDSSMCSLPHNLSFYYPKSNTVNLFIAATRVGPEMDLEVEEVDCGHAVIFKMTLDD